MIEKLKQKIQAFISSYVNSGLRKIVQSKVISCGAKMIYRSVNRIAQVALKKLVEVREKYDKETELEKKNKNLVGVKLGSA